MWLLDAFGAAITNASFGIEQKRLSPKAGALFLSAWTRIWSLPLTLVVLIFLPQTWHIRPVFWIYLLICGTLTALGTYLTYVAYKNLDFSIAFPILSISPAVALLASWAIDKTRPSLVGVIGVILVAYGTYRLTSTKRQLLAPLKNKSTWTMLAVATIYAITTSYDKLGVAASSPAIWTLGVNLTITAIQWPLSQRSRRAPRKQPSYGGFGLVGTLAAAVMLFQMYSLQAGGYVPYLLAIKQLSVILAVLASWHALKERPNIGRLVNAVIVTTGVLIIALD